MPYRIRALDDAIRRSRRDTAALGEELANARKTCAATQAEVARALGWSASKVRRIEHGQRQSVSHSELASFAAVVGLSYSGRMFVGTTRLRDATQLTMINSYRSFAVSHGWACRIEEPLSLTGDLRAFDVMLRAAAARVPHEFISRLRDAQAQVRPILQKQRDSGLGSVILVIRDTAENRRAVREAGPAFRDQFPLDARAVLSAVRDRRDPGVNGIVFWREARAHAASRSRRSPAVAGIR